MKPGERKQANQAKALSELSEQASLRLGTDVKPRRLQIRSERLQAVFGLGDIPRVTLALYDRLERRSQIEGPKYAEIVAVVARAAKTARNPANYFAAVVTRRLRERGFE